MKLSDFFNENKSVAVALSGGADSAYLLYAAKQYCERVTAYYVKTLFQPRFELEDAKKIAKYVGAELKIIELDILSDPRIRENPENRCYFCKQMIFSAICKAAKNDGYTAAVDGTNLSDSEDDRPGMRALRELSVFSPLRECGLTKDDIRFFSKKAGLFTWNKPAYACLATRIPCGCALSEEKLRRTEEAEDFLFSLGFSDFRVRELHGSAKIQIKNEQLPLLFQYKDEIVSALKKSYNGVLLDMEGR